MLRPVELSTIMDREKLSGLQWLVFVLGFLVFFCDGLDTGILGFIAPALLGDWKITKPQLAPVLSAALFGMSIGALVAGPLADKFGRRIVILATTFLFAIFTIMSGFAGSTTELMIYRLITGIGLGAAMPNITTLVSEYMPIKRRAFLTGLSGCGFLLGVSFGGVLSASFLEALGWANVIIIGGVLPLVLSFILLLKLPESVPFLINHQQQDKAKLILEKIVHHPFASDEKIVHNQNQSNTTASPIKVLLSQYFFGFVMICVCCFTSLLVFYLLTSWMPTILKTAGFSTQQFSLIAAIFPFGGVIGAIIMSWLMDKTEPAKIIQYAYFLAAIFLIITGFVAGNTVLLGISIFLAGGLLAGAQTALLPLAAIIYPASCRAVGVSWMHGIGRIGAILGALFGSLIFTFNLSINTLFYVLAIPAFISFVALLLLLRDKANKIEMANA